eukprot:GFYU01012683.1.p1 GENE.GFYU01012683.1~~GFYU01012683.1.p1  ORF type:complete len:245 (-),score=38.40 GFYU01012683.1:30-764(-)
MYSLSAVTAALLAFVHVSQASPSSLRGYTPAWLEDSEPESTRGAKLPTLKWPEVFSSDGIETTWANDLSSTSSLPAHFSYDWSKQSFIITRQNSSLNPICKEVMPGYTGSCVQHSVDPYKRYLYFPEISKCCVDCTEYCGTVNPKWVTAPPTMYGGLRNYHTSMDGSPRTETMCNTWTIESNTPDRVALSAEDPEVICEIYDGGANFAGDGAWLMQFDLTTFKKSTPSLELPAMCNNAPPCKSD